MKKIEGYEFWKRLDQLNSYSTLKKLVDVCGLDYNTIKKQRTDVRVPKVDTIYSFATELNTSIEFLISGKDNSSNSSYPPRIKKIADKLCNVAELHLLSIESIVDTLPLETVENKAQIS